MPNSEFSLNQHVTKNIDIYGDRPAVVFENIVFKYGELLELSDNLRKQLHSDCKEDNDFIVLTCSESPLLANLYNICLALAGIPYEPLSLSEPLERSATKANKWSNYVLLTDTKTAEKLDEIGSRAAKYLVTDDLEDFKICAENQCGSNGVDTSRYIYILSTSGSSGVPKSVPISHSNLQAYLENAVVYFEVREPMVYSAIHDVCFDFNIHELYLALYTHGTIAIASKADLMSPAGLKRYIEKHNIQFWSCVPSYINHLSHLIKNKSVTYPSIQKTMICGEPLSPSICEVWKRMAPKSAIHNMYGPTECTVCVSGKDITKFDADDIKDNIYTLGYSFPNVHMCVLTDDEIRQFGVGELLIGGKQVFDGYMVGGQLDKRCLQYSELNDSYYYKTGDIVEIVRGRPTAFISRGDDQLQIRGHRIQKSEIVNTIRSEIPCSNCAVVEILGESNTVTGVVLFISGVSETEFEIRKKLTRVLPSYALPQKINLGELPMNKNMKIDLKLLFAMVNTPDKVSELFAEQQAVREAV